MRRIAPPLLIFGSLVLIAVAATWLVDPGIFDTPRNLLFVFGAAIVGVATFLGGFIPLWAEWRKPHTDESQPPPAPSLSIGGSVTQHGQTNIIATTVETPQIGGTHIAHADQVIIHPASPAGSPTPPAPPKSQEMQIARPQGQAAAAPNVLLVTVAKVEAQAVLEASPQASGVPWERRQIGDKTYFALGRIGGADVFMAQSEMGTATPGGALLTIHKAIETLRPEAIILVGIAFGVNPKRQKLGDILVSKQIMAYEPGKEKGRFIPRGDRVTCSPALLGKFRSGELDWKGAPVHFGLALSGEKLVNDLAFRAQLLDLEPEAIGGEMEGAGLYLAASDAKVDWILVKGIGNWADGKKRDKYQPLAAHNAAGFVLHVIQQGGWKQSSPSPAQPGEGQKAPLAAAQTPPPASPPVQPLRTQEMLRSEDGEQSMHGKGSPQKQKMTDSRRGKQTMD